VTPRRERRTRRTERGARGAGTGKPAARRKRAGRGMWIATLIAIIVLSAAVAWWKLRPRSHSPVDPLAGVSPDAAADSITSSVDHGRMLEAIPYVRKIESQMPAPDPDFLGQFARILTNATIQKRDLHGLTIPATRSAVERVALVREALARLDVAERIARTNQDRSAIVVARARILSVWGFQREAYAQYRRANAFAPLDHRARSEGVWIELMTADPTHAVAAPDSGRGP
jgi:hypothetical protein